MCTAVKKNKHRERQWKTSVQGAAATWRRAAETLPRSIHMKGRPLTRHMLLQHGGVQRVGHLHLGHDGAIHAAAESRLVGRNPGGGLGDTPVSLLQRRQPLPFDAVQLLQLACGSKTYLLYSNAAFLPPAAAPSCCPAASACLQGNSFVL